MKMDTIRDIKKVSEIVPEGYQEQFKQIGVQILRDMDKNGNGRRPEPKVLGATFETVACKQTTTVTSDLADKYDTNPDLVREQISTVEKYVEKYAME